MTCESIQDVEFSPDALEYTVTYLPGVQYPDLLPAAVRPVSQPPGSVRWPQPGRRAGRRVGDPA